MPGQFSREISAASKARIAGVLYLVVIAGGLFAEIGVRQQLIAPGDAATTAQNILAREGLFRAGLGVNLFYLLCNIPFAVLFFDLFKRTNLTIARMMMLLIVLTTAIEAANLLQLLTALDHLTGNFFNALAPAQRNEFAYVSLQGFASGFAVSLTFFGLVCLTYGGLILQSGLLPRGIGILISLAGVCYLINSFALVLAPNVAATLFPYILLPSFVGELSLAIWLTLMGVSSKKQDVA